MLLSRSLGAFICASALTSITPVYAEIKDATWIGWNGSWDEAAKWSGGVVPENNATDQFNVFVDGGGFLGAAVKINEQTINTLTVDYLDRIDILPFGDFTALGGMQINGYAALADRAIMRVGANQALTGTGAIEGFYGNNYIQSLGGSLTIGAGLRVGNGAWPESGTMQIGEATYPLINNGTIAALRYTVTALGTTVTNNGTFRTANAGLLQIGGTIQQMSQLGSMVNDDGTGVFRFIGTVDNSANTFVVDRTVTGLEFGGTIQGGTVTATSNHRLNTSALTLDLDGVTLNAPTTVNGRLRVGSGQSLQGTADVLLNSVNSVVDSAGGTFTIGSGVVLHGRGAVGTNALPLVTAASVTADQSNAQLLVTGNGITNTGTLRVTNGGILAIGGSFTMSGLGTVVNDGGTLRLNGTLNNSALTFVNGSPQSWQLGTGGAIVGGTVNTLSGHDLVVVNGAIATLDSVTLNGTVRLGTGTNTRLAIPNGITGNGTILLAGTSTTATQIFNPQGNSVGPVEIGEGITIRGGGGTIGGLPTPTISPPHVTNHGTIQADTGTTIDIIGATLSDGSLVIKEGGRIRSRGNLSFGDGGILGVDVAGTKTQAVLNITGDLDLTGNDLLSVTSLGGLGTTFLVATFTGTRTGEFDSVTTGFAADYSIPGQIRVVAVPEPAVVTVAGLSMLLVIARRSSRKLR
jgi:hypothetical protein